MILSVRLGDIEAMVDTDTAGETHNPDVALDFLSRLANTVVATYNALPDPIPAADDTSE